MSLYKVLAQKGEMGFYPLSTSLWTVFRFDFSLKNIIMFYQLSTYFDCAFISFNKEARENVPLSVELCDSIN